MGRPSKKEQRTAEILNAFYHCVARFGLEGSTLERIAQEAGLNRSLVRHFAGNREELTTQLIDHVLLLSTQQWQKMLAVLPEQNGSEFLLSGLSNPKHIDPKLVQVIESLIFAAERDAQMRLRMQTWLRSFIDNIAAILQKDYPNAKPESIAAVSYGLTSLYFNLDSLGPLGLNYLYQQPAHTAAEYLLQHLKSPAADTAAQTDLTQPLHSHTKF